LFASSTNDTVFCGGSFTSSTLGVSQAVNCTYDLVFIASAS
jgi:hypothetical protein